MEFSNFSDAIRLYDTQLIRSFVYAGIATVACLLPAYPLVYSIAFRAAAGGTCSCSVIVAPFFVTYSCARLRMNILADEGPVVGLLRGIHVLGEDERAAGHDVRRDFRDHLQLFPPSWRCRSTCRSSRSTRGSWRRRADLYGSPTQAFLRVTLPLSAPGIVAGTLLTFIPAAGDFINAALLGTPKQQMIGNVIQAKFSPADYLTAAAPSFILMALDPRGAPRLCPHRGHGEADR